MKFTPRASAFICGVDEAGRGPLAAGVRRCRYSPRDAVIDGLNDSKKLTGEEARRAL